MGRWPDLLSLDHSHLCPAVLEAIVPVLLFCKCAPSRHLLENIIVKVRGLGGGLTVSRAVLGAVDRCHALVLGQTGHTLLSGEEIE